MPGNTAMKRDNIVANLVLLGAVTFNAFIGCTFVAAGHQYLFGPVPVDGETRDPTASERVFGILSIGLGLSTGFVGIHVVRNWSTSSDDDDQSSARRRP